MSRYWKLVGRALRLKCPLCGQGSLFKGWFSMNQNCPNCGVKFEREPGFFLGSIYINYGITAVVTTVLYLVMMFTNWRSTIEQMVIAVAVAIILPMLLHRHARALWAGFDQWHDPRDGEV
ncbi:DUF983 domain-containing protein [Anatilimnocola floriformis]|uniref:DUF983 domain-containing protein n=1 Tax=Anatilimnocola floriformis TaxID=2948575 RepID=UPI0020C1EFCC|nr:DUF983 domain-containing protein [Anatilimnocola floriformis]